MKKTTELLMKATNENEIKTINTRIDAIRKYLYQVSHTLRNSGLRTGAIKDIIAFSTDDKLKFNADIHLFAFENKILDLQNDCFVEPSPDQYISKSCGYNYDDNYDENNIKDLEKGFNVYIS